MDNIRQCVLRIGEELDMIDRIIMEWMEYHASLSPFDAPPAEGVSLSGGRPVVNLLRGDLQPFLALIRHVAIAPRAAPPPIAASLRTASLTMPLFWTRYPDRAAETKDFGEF